VGASWQGNYVGAVLLGLMFATAFGAMSQSYLPLTLIVAALVTGSILVGRFAPIKPVPPRAPMAPWLRTMHYAVLVFAVMALAYSFIKSA